MNGLVGKLVARRPQVAPLGVYRSVNGLIGSFLGDFWFTNIHGGPKKVNDFFYRALHTYEISVTLDSPQTNSTLKSCFTTFGRLVTLKVKTYRDVFFIFRPNRGCCT